MFSSSEVDLIPEASKLYLPAPMPSGADNGLVYSPLSSEEDSIRLLTIFPGEEDENEIICDLHTVSFAEKPKYEALSYTWGTDPPTKKILIGTQAVMVRENLYQALYHLRQQQQRTLWIDAICINQESPQERQQQVGLMSFIYKRAACVLVWLGFDVSGSYNNQWVCHKSYWTRLWIIQEIGLATEIQVIFGHHSEDWDGFVARILQVEFPAYQLSFMKKLDEKRKDRHGSSNRLEILLEDFQDAECSEPRDKIYALLGLAHDAADGSIQADYEIPLYELYINVLFFLLRSREDLGFSDDLGSSDIVRCSVLVQKLLGDIEYPCSEVITASSSEILKNTDRLHSVLGFTGGNICHIGPNYKEIIGSSTANKQWVSSFEDHAYTDPKVLREANEAFSHVLLSIDDAELAKIRNIDPEMRSKGMKYDRDVHGTLSWGWLRGEEDFEVHGGQTPFPEQSTYDPKASADHASQLHMFITEFGFIGLAPPGAKKDDVLCMFAKAPVAALLRAIGKGKDGDTIYCIVGRVLLSMGTLEKGKPVYKKWHDSCEDGETMFIDMYIRTLISLTC